MPLDAREREQAPRNRQGTRTRRSAMQTEQTQQAAPRNSNEALVEWYPMVERIAHRAAATYGLPASVDAADLVSSGVLGLAEAWDRFDPERGVAFEAFAIPRIKGSVIDAIRA